MMLVAFDCETTGLNPWKNDRPFALSLTWEDNRTEYFSWRVDPFTRKVQPPNTAQRKYLTSVLSDPTIDKVGHNVKFDCWMIEIPWGITIAGTIHDTMIMARICDSLEPNLGLKRLANKYLGIPDDDQKALQASVIDCRREARKRGWNLGEDTAQDYWLPVALARTQEEIDACKEYCTLDTQRTIVLYRMYRAVLDSKPAFANAYQQELKLWPTTKRMEGCGIRTDLTLVKSRIAWCDEQEVNLRKKLELIFGPFKKKISDQKMRRYLFSSRKEGGLGLEHDPEKVTEKGIPQVTRDVLESFEDEVPIVRAKIDLDKISKARGTYFQNYLDKAVPEGKYHVLHANFDQVGAKTGRFSCREPNLQNVPKRAKEGDVMQTVRAPFGPRPDCIWLHLDYQGIEARIFADEANESDMLRIFAANGDVYQELVNRIVAMTGLDLVTLLAFADSIGKPGSGARQICKNNFLGWLYGEGFWKLMRAMHLPTAEIAKQVIIALREAYPKAMPFMDKMQSIAQRQKFVTNRYGRQIPIQLPMWDKGKIVQFWYKATNYLIQGTAANMIKNAMPKCEDYLINLGYGRMVLQIHDELIFEFPEDRYDSINGLALSSIMQNAAEEHFDRVCFPVDASITRKQWSTPEKAVFTNTPTNTTTIKLKPKLILRGN